jgi:phage major head subunit gpT-like protein
MGALTPQFLMDLESRMQVVTENEYSRLTQNLWWQNLAKVRTTTASKEIIAWLLSTAQIYPEGKGGNIRFDDLLSTYTTMEPRFSGAGLKLNKAQFEDTDGQGVNLAAEWSSQIGAQIAYWPQEQVARFLMTAHQAGVFVGYDGKPFFAVDHPVNPYRTGVTFANLLTGTAGAGLNTGTTSPGALPIDESVSVEVALANLQKLFAYICSIKMPNGKQPRRLRPRFLLTPPGLTFRAVQLTQAKFIAQATAGGGAASADVEALIAALGYATPVQADELAGFEDDKTYFVACEQINSTQLGAITYLEREAYKILYYGSQTEAELDRRDEYEWHVKGRNGLGAGHPFLLFKVKGV